MSMEGWAASLEEVDAVACAGFRREDGLMGLFEALVNGFGAANFVSSLVTFGWVGCFNAGGRIDELPVGPGFLFEMSS
jgi:hypothetical protein